MIEALITVVKIAFTSVEFHHKNPGVKEKALSQASLWGWGEERLLEEIRKCEVLCANCHRKHHATMV